MTILILVVAATLLVSAICSLLEASFYSTRVVALEAARAEGRHRQAADLTLKMKKDVATPTSAILILNTVANTAGATFAGMYAASVLGAGFVPAFSVLLTVLILLLSEILPKTFGASNWKVLWPITARPLAILSRALSPAIWFTRKLSSLATGKTSAPLVTEDEIRASVRLGGKAGQLSSSELQILESAFHLEETTCVQVMIPRNEIRFVDAGAAASELTELWSTTRHTRYPVCKGSLDNVLGILHAKDLVGVDLSAEVSLPELVRPIARVPESLNISRVLREMQRSHRQMVLVVNEFGVTTGLVTLKDILEEIVGTLQDEHELELPEITKTSEGYAIRGNVALAKVNRELGLDLYEIGVVTLSGLLMSKLGRVPKQGDQVELEGALAKVTEAPANSSIIVQLYMPSQRRPEVQDDEEA